MESGKRTFCLCFKMPFFSFTIKSGDSAIDARKAEHEASAAVAFAQGVSQIIGAMFRKSNEDSKSESSNGGRDKTNNSRRSASA